MRIRSEIQKEITRLKATHVDFPELEEWKKGCLYGLEWVLEWVLED